MEQFTFINIYYRGVSITLPAYHEANAWEKLSSYVKNPEEYKLKETE